jgi:hypothetical protein
LEGESYSPKTQKRGQVRQGVCDRRKSWFQRRPTPLTKGLSSGGPLFPTELFHVQRRETLPLRGFRLQYTLQVTTTCLRDWGPGPDNRSATPSTRRPMNRRSVQNGPSDATSWQPAQPHDPGVAIVLAQRRTAQRASRHERSTVFGTARAIPLLSQRLPRVGTADPSQLHPDSWVPARPAESRCASPPSNRATGEQGNQTPSETGRDAVKFPLTSLVMRISGVRVSSQAPGPCPGGPDPQNSGVVGYCGGGGY